MDLTIDSEPRALAHIGGTDGGITVRHADGNRALGAGVPGVLDMFDLPGAVEFAAESVRPVREADGRVDGATSCEPPPDPGPAGLSSYLRKLLKMLYRILADCVVLVARGLLAFVVLAGSSRALGWVVVAHCPLRVVGDRHRVPRLICPLTRSRMRCAPAPGSKVSRRIRRVTT